MSGMAYSGSVNGSMERAASGICVESAVICEATGTAAQSESLPSGSCAEPSARSEKLPGESSERAVARESCAAGKEQGVEREEAGKASWYVLRDLKRANARERGYRMLEERGFEVFTPMRWRVVTRYGRRVREEVPVISDLLFVRTRREELDPLIEKTPTLQYRYVRGTYREAMRVKEEEMEAFIRAVRSAETVRYYSPGELTEGMCGRRIRIVGGGLDGLEGRLLKVRGTSKRRILVELPGILSAGVEVSPEFIVFV